MRIKKIYALILLGLGCFSFNCFADDDTDTLQRNLLQLQNQVNDLQSQLAQSNGTIEELNHEIASLKTQNQALQNRLASSSAGNNGDSSAPTDSNATTSTQANPIKAPSLSSPDLSKVSSDVKQAYDAAYAFVVKEDLSKAAAAFSNFIGKYQENELTPNAWYWLGQVQYKQKDLQNARVSFLHAASYKTSGKRPDSLYKLGLISKALGDKDKAAKYFEVVIKSYPNDTSAALANKELQALTQ